VSFKPLKESLVSDLTSLSLTICHHLLAVKSNGVLV
jgi:hypothetical protein